MAETFLTFRKFQDIALAESIATHLKDNHIDYLLEDNRGKYFDVSFAYNTVEPEIFLKVKGEDFEKANIALDNYYRQHLDDVDKSYYLFGFTNEELMEIVSKPDEWGSFDYQLAQKILDRRGQNINSDTVTALREQRNEQLAAPEKAGKSLIVQGYIFAILGGFIGIFIGWHLCKARKTLPNGQRAFIYEPEDRQQGRSILWLSSIILALIIIIRIILFIKEINE